MKRGAPPPTATRPAARALRWPGTALPAVSLFGLTFWPIVALHRRVHDRRQRDGDPPQLDEDTLTIWEWPEPPAPQGPGKVVR